MPKKKFQPIIPNKSARRDYELIDYYTAGIVLLGHEVKSIRSGTANLKGAYINFIGQELWLINAYVAPYAHAKPDTSYDPNRSRKLLLSKAELIKLVKAKADELTIVPTKLLVASRHIKLEFATARGLKRHDKRQKILKEIATRETRMHK